MNTNAKLLRAGALLLAMGAICYALVKPDVAPQAPRAEPNYFAFVRSMEGTHPDGDIRQDAGARLVVDAELGHLFDYYLAGLGERSLDDIRTQIERELDRRLLPPAAAQAKRLLAQYLRYKRALVDVERGLAATGDLARDARARLNAMQQLRLNYFTPAESAGLFGAGDAYDEDTLVRLEINGDRSLSEEQRQQKLAALDAKLPAAVRENRDAPAKVLRLEESVQQLRAQGAGDNEVYRLRAAALTPAAAARLADLDREEADWKQRIGDYQAQRIQLLNAATAPSPEALQQLRDARFTPEEQRRLGAYE